MSEVLRELHGILQQITGKVHSGDWEDVEEREYWQGKKDGLRLALAMLDEDYKGYADILRYSQNARFVRREEQVLGMDEQQTAAVGDAAQEGVE